MPAKSPANSPTGVVLLNMGGPQILDEVGPFLLRLFEDRDLMRLPFHAWLGPLIARMRRRKVRQLYQAIGGGSPILKWTRTQGEGMARWLDELAPHTAPHKAYVAFRYVPPFSRDALRQMHADGVQRAIAFSQYPQFSCSTTGSSLNELWRAALGLGLENAFRWSVIDRWPAHPGFVRAMAASVQRGLDLFPPEERASALLLFSAHSLPLHVIDRGDPYPQEVGASVQAVMERLRFSNEYLLCFQSAVGPVRWLGPSTGKVLRRLGERQRHNVLVVPIAFTCDHIETLSEIDREYAEVAHRAGIQNFRRAPALNDDPDFQRALAEIVADHLQRGEVCSSQYRLRCPACANEHCRQILNPA
jgi:ferrochelatase